MKGGVEFVIPSQKGESEYVGFDLREDAVRFVFPCRYFPPEEAGSTEEEKAVRARKLKAEARKILSLIKQVQKEFSLGGGESETSRFYSMIWLLRDYIDRGYYTETEHVIGKGDHGKIVWKRTLRDSGIYFDGRDLLYRDFFVRKNKPDDANLLAQIYKCCLAESAEYLGFLYNVSQTERSVFRIDSEHDVGFMCYHVQRELGRTFNSYKKVLLRHLLTILQGKQGRFRAVSLYMHDREFEYVFEFLVNSIFGTENVHEYYNEYYYVIGEKKISAAKLRPDTIMRGSRLGDPDFFVIDAKYYNYGYTENPRDLPQASAIAKQIGYNFYLHENYIDEKGNGGKTFYSVFLLPFAAERKDGELASIDCAFRLVGYATNRKAPMASGRAENKVAVCLVDLKMLVDVCFHEAHTAIEKAIGKKEMRDALRRAVRRIF